jgi:DNA-directed RNA polymerase subunit RPC12/RpoP
VTPEPKADRYRCVACSAMVGLGGTQPTVDPRWRMGRCPGCSDPRAVFRRVDMSPIRVDIRPDRVHDGATRGGSA